MCHSSNAELQNELTQHRIPSLILGVLFIWLWFLWRVILAELQVILQMHCKAGYWNIQYWGSPLWKLCTTPCSTVGFKYAKLGITLCSTGVSQSEVLGTAPLSTGGLHCAKLCTTACSTGLIHDAVLVTTPCSIGGLNFAKLGTAICSTGYLHFA